MARLDRKWQGRRVQVETGADGMDHELCLRMWDRLVEAGNDEVLEDIVEGRVKMNSLLTVLLSGERVAALARPLWDTVTTMFCTKKHARYRVSFAALKETGVLPAKARIRDLKHVDWEKLERDWGRSAADWNHLRRGVGRFLTRVLKNRHHQFRSEVMLAIPIREEVPRVPTTRPEEVLQIQDPEARDIAHFLMMTGARLGEYYRMQPEHFKDNVLVIPGTKTKGSWRKVRVDDPDMAAFVARMIPPPLSRPVFRKRFEKARKDLGLSDLRVHDLRHLFGQAAADSTDMRTVANLMGHANIEQSFRYASRQAPALPVSRTRKPKAEPIVMPPEEPNPVFAVQSHEVEETPVRISPRATTAPGAEFDILQLREEGYNYDDIAERVGRSPTFVYRVLSEAGAVKSPQRIRGSLYVSEMDEATEALADSLQRPLTEVTNVLH